MLKPDLTQILRREQPDLFQNDPRQGRPVTMQPIGDLVQIQSLIAPLFICDLLEPDNKL